MSASRNFKLGLFVIGALVSAVVAAIVLGIHAVAPKTVAYHTYFDESVQGLEIGAPVKYRGVRIGTVDKIDLAPDRRHVDVVLALTEHDAKRLDVAVDAPFLRTQLGGQGLTGLKFVDIDFVDPKRNPPPEIPFPVPALYIPSRPSLMTGLANELENLKGRVPVLVDHGTQTLDRMDRMLDDIHNSRLVERAGASLDRFAAASTSVRKLAERSDGAVAQATSVLRQLDGANGLVASAHRATDTVGELGRTTVASADELTRTVRDLGDAARAIRELAEELERDPALLIKGPARSSER